jgi:hypothetical protein
MIDRERLADYLDGAADPELEALLELSPELFQQLATQHRTDRLLQSVIGSKAELRESILASAQGRSLDQLKREVIRDISVLDRLRAWRIGLSIGFAAGAILLVANWQSLTVQKSAESAATALHAAPLQLVELIGDVLLQGSAVKESAVVRQGDAIRIAPNGRATLLLTDQTRLRLGPGAELVVGSGDGKRLHLNSGELQAAVQKQSSGESLQITTPLAHLRVVGTTFSVSAATSRTLVEVAEGLVRVNHAQRESAVELRAGEFAMAVPQSELHAGVLPSENAVLSTEDKDFVRHPFAADSPWNKKLGDARYAPIKSGAFDFSSHGAVILPAAHGRPLWIGSDADPVMRISSRYTGEEFAVVPVPAGLLNAQGDWLNGTLIDAGAAVAYELNGARRGPDGIEVMWCLPVNLRGSGIPPEQNGNTFSGLPALAGVIRAGELKAGIHHALSVAALHEGLNRTAGHGQPFVRPARHMPLEVAQLERMGTVGNVCYGTRLAIPKEVDLAELELSAAGLEIGKALQDYGAIVTHSFPSIPGGRQGNWRQPHLQFFSDEPLEDLDQRLSADLSVLITKLTIVTP